MERSEGNEERVRIGKDVGKNKRGLISACLAKELPMPAGGGGRNQKKLSKEYSRGKIIGRNLGDDGGDKNNDSKTISVMSRNDSGEFSWAKKVTVWPWWLYLKGGRLKGNDSLPRPVKERNSNWPTR